MATQASDEEVRALVIEMRRYIKRHGLLIGECVAWNKLKKLTNVAQGSEADFDQEVRWAETYRDTRQPPIAY